MPGTPDDLSPVAPPLSGPTELTQTDNGPTDADPDDLLPQDADWRPGDDEAAE
jgi:hypothetical protein